MARFPHCSSTMRSRSPRGSLSREVVLDAALALIDRVGVDHLSVRGLADELARPPMTLYSHFDSKQALLDLAFAHLVHRLFVTHRHATWQAELEAACRHIRRELVGHPHWVALLTRVRVPSSALHVYDHLLGLMLEDGFRPEAAMFAFSSIISHALGSALAERLMDGKPSVPQQRLELVRRMLADGSRGSFPRIRAVSSKFDRWTFDRVFEVGLRSLVTGLDESSPRRKGYRRSSRRAG